MTPKEKAEELVEKFRPHVTTWDCYWDAPSNPDDVTADAKKCALITVDEVKNQLILNLPNDISAIYAIYWNKVKKEIESL